LLGASFTGCLDSLPFGDDDEQTPSSFVSDYMNVLGKGDHSSFCDYKLGLYGYPLDDDAKNQCKMDTKEDALTLEYDVNYKHDYEILKIEEMGSPTNPQWNPDIQQIYKVNISYIPCLRINADELWNCEGQYLESQVVKLINSDNHYFTSFFYYEDINPVVYIYVETSSGGEYYAKIHSITVNSNLADFQFQLLRDDNSIYTGTNVQDMNEIALQMIAGEEHGIERTYNGDDDQLESRAANVSADDGSEYPVNFNDNDRDGKLSIGDQFTLFGTGNSANGPVFSGWKLVIYYNYAYTIEIGTATIN